MKFGKTMAGIVAGSIIAALVLVAMPADVFAADPAPKAVQGCPGYGTGKGPGRGPGMMQGMGQRGYMHEDLAKFLGIDAAKLRAERQSGKSLAAIAKENGKSEEDVLNYIMSQHKARLDQLVKAGRLTKEQAAERETFMKERIKANISREGFGPGAGGCGGPGMGHRGGWSK
ncbi:MAG: hypothetical protein N2491_13085 [Negativicutes bacterium]|nr:hypothetical protein [Negativicutes bacterium]